MYTTNCLLNRNSILRMFCSRSIRMNDNVRSSKTHMIIFWLRSITSRRSHLVTCKMIHFRSIGEIFVYCIEVISGKKKFFFTLEIRIEQNFSFFSFRRIAWRFVVYFSLDHFIGLFIVQSPVIDTMALDIVQTRGKEFLISCFFSSLQTCNNNVDVHL